MKKKKKHKQHKFFRSQIVIKPKTETRDKIQIATVGKKLPVDSADPNLIHLSGSSTERKLTTLVGWKVQTPKCRRGHCSGTRNH